MNDNDKHIYTEGDYTAVSDGQEYWVVHTPTGVIKGFFRTGPAAAKAAARFERRDENIRPPRITPEEHAAFNLELPKLRSTSRKIRGERLKYIKRHKLPPLDLVLDWEAQNIIVFERLNHWEAVLIPDKATRQIRSPVRLWDALNKLRTLADLNADDLNYYLEQHAVRRPDTSASEKVWGQ